MSLNDSLPLAYNDPLVGRHVVECFRAAPRPAHAALPLARGPQTKVNPKITLRNEIPAAAHFIDLLALPGRHSDSRPDRVAAGCGQRPYQQRIPAGAEGFQPLRRL